MDAVKVEYSIQVKLSYQEDRFASKRSSDVYELLLGSAALSPVLDSCSTEPSNQATTPLVIGKEVDHE